MLTDSNFQEVQKHGPGFVKILTVENRKKSTKCVKGCATE